MLALVRLRRLEALRKTLTISISKNNLVRTITTSPKKNETSVPTTNTCEPPKKFWVSYGFDYSDENIDKHGMHSLFFLVVSVVFCGGFVFMAYQPDAGLRNWAQREAYLELRRREELGLPPIDPNLIDPALVKLPSDEELGDTDIII
ncbi:NADH dehydrogenase [ubiquinone] 1 beta subcomplex subunit 11, mitochondrial [Cephus cinctus]|uniref:NADH dehydrogenase [ubiquinone] 1 beta subcomplex subunit 11, mitochondrial n=1 Tax=Cephus cinctus TaxID=211228 RepID=A0AAJ7BWI8_CEPCN|nr:NADH dehydrogenase [ubiquinone] 1 beta subcomplex subunit 11, mitochondrial [Cephus cinctus]